MRRPGPRPRTLTGVSREQAGKAGLLISDGGLVPHPSHDGVWFVVSDDGERWYLTSQNGCTCTGGKFGVKCYHQLAAAILASGKPGNLSRREYRAAAHRGRGEEQEAMREIARIAAMLERKL